MTLCLTLWLAFQAVSLDLGRDLGPQLQLLGLSLDQACNLPFDQATSIPTQIRVARVLVSDEFVFIHEMRENLCFVRNGYWQSSR